MHYVEPIIRPPSEADSILLQVTTGCSHNKCTFCGVYKGKKFSFVPESIVDEDIAYAARHFRDVKRLFLIDGDALIIPQARLIGILERVRALLPWVARVGTYANAKAISRKTDEELRQLRAAGLNVVHMGLESGDNEVLRHVCKHGDSAFIVEQGRRVQAAGMKLFVTVLLGLGGTARSESHAIATGKALSAMDPNYVGALSLMLLENTPLFSEWKAGAFTEVDPRGLLHELRLLIAHTDVTRCLFFSNHASNHLPIQARLPSQKQDVLARIDSALSGEVPLRAEWMRGL
jgi:radical SAM superfamily enzyme YgiQ (UPF0313 family)